MKESKRVLCLVLPLMLMVSVVLGLLVGLGISRADADDIMPVAMSSIRDGQVVTSDEDTGAKAASKEYKSGAIFIEPNMTMTMENGTISDHKNTYGGAIYVSSGATFTMTGGTISNNKATYGGAIYVESGGKCYIQGGTIEGNEAKAGSAIFVEAGGTIEVSSSAVIENNKTVHEVEVSVSKETVGHTSSSLQLYTTKFGSYPQTYVGEALRTEIENWYAAATSNPYGYLTPDPVNTYTMGDGASRVSGDASKWVAYNYKGEVYARVQESQEDITSVYSDRATASTGRWSWFKVEPIKWYILNYEEWKAGKEIELLSTQVLAGNVCFNHTTSQGNSWRDSDIRYWCNTYFYGEAFSDVEKASILSSTVHNNITGDYSGAGSDDTGMGTQDYIYLKSYYEMTSGKFVDDDDHPYQQLKIYCAPTDFAVANNIKCVSGSTTVYSSVTAYYWLRSAGSEDTLAAHVVTEVYDSGNVTYLRCGVRPALHLVR